MSHTLSHSDCSSASEPSGSSAASAPGVDVEEEVVVRSGSRVDVEEVVDDILLHGLTGLAVVHPGVGGFPLFGIALAAVTRRFCFDYFVFVAGDFLFGFMKSFLYIIKSIFIFTNIFLQSLLILVF